MWTTGFLNALKARIIGFLKDESPYRVVLSSMFLIFDIMDKHEYLSLLAFLCLFLEPGIRKPSHITLIKWCSLWVWVAMSVGVNQLSLFLSTLASSIMCLLALYFIFKVIRYIIPFPCEARKWPDIWTIILHVSSVVIVACCIFLSYCREKPLKQRYLKDKSCSSWLAPACIALSSYSYTFIGLHIANYVAERSVESGEEYKKNKKTQPDFLDMVPWYSCTSADLYKIVFDLLVSVTVFVGSFDLRILQATMNQYQLELTEETKGDYLYDHFSEEKELWFDFMADTGDGGNSTYTVARLLAQPQIRINSKILKRGDLILIGGNLAYPNPSEFTYEKRLFRPFEYAFQPPLCHEREHIGVKKLDEKHPYYEQQCMTVNKSVVPVRMTKLKQDKKRTKKRRQSMSYNGPRCFIIPGNHDWLDGLHTFTRNICHKSWLGGWFMPQKKSYFALQLPMGWWIFGLDLALLGDIDVHQFEFFSKLAMKTVGNNDSVIVMTHQPDWLLDWYENGDSRYNVSDYQSKGKNVLDYQPKGNNVSNYQSKGYNVLDYQSKGNNVSDLICNILKKRCKLRIAGNIHHYMRHSTISSQLKRNNNEPFYAQHLLINGCGGAYAHPTHVFRDFKESHGVSYECKAAYPSFEKSRKLALGNILNFFNGNWQFRFVCGIIYSVLVFSMLPQCELDHIFQEDSIFGFLRSFFGTVWNAFIYMLDRSYVSLGGATLLLIVAVAFVPSKVSCKTRVLIGLLHVSAHLVTALILMLVLEVGIEMLVRHKSVETSGYHSLYQWLQAMFHKHLPVSITNQDTIKQCMKYLMSAFHLPELMVVTRNNICKNGMKSISSWGANIYYASIFLYFWVLSTPAISFVFGSYLYICTNWFNLHYDEAFSSLRIADYKAFTRFHIKHNGDLEVFTLAVDKVPDEWEQDPEWEEMNSDQLSHLKKNPSQWKAAASDQEPLKTVKIIDEFVIRR